MTFECVSLLAKWVPEPSSETLTVTEAEDMFYGLGQAFQATAALVGPSLVESKVYRRWVEGIARPT